MEYTANIAVAKGRVFSKVRPLLAAAGLAPHPADVDSRKLVLDTERKGVKIVIVRGSDVPTYVTHGVTALGIVGKDVLMEYEGRGIYEVLDLNIARCRLMVAGNKGSTPSTRRIRVATKYVKSAYAHFSRKGIQAELIKLYGSVELSTLVGLSDFIVDLVDTGGTLAENGLVGIEEIAKISTRVIANKAAMKMNRPKLEEIVELLKNAMASSTVMVDRQ